MKKIILVLVAVILVCASAGCIAEEENVWFGKRYIPYDYDNYYIFVDEETGVEYIYIYSTHGGLAPRYSADGTLKINEDLLI